MTTENQPTRLDVPEITEIPRLEAVGGRSIEVQVASYVPDDPEAETAVWCWWHHDGDWAAGRYNTSDDPEAERQLGAWLAAGEALRRFGKKPNIRLVTTAETLAVQANQNKKLSRRAWRRLHRSQLSVAGWRPRNKISAEKRHPVQAAVLAENLYQRAGVEHAGPAAAYSYGGVVRVGGKETAVVYTDGSGGESHPVSGWAYTFGGPAVSGTIPTPSSNAAELEAAIQGIAAAASPRIHVCTDNEVVARVIRGEGTNASGDGATKAVELAETLKGRDVTVARVVAHGRVPGNCVVDVASRAARNGN